jgi:hypothetical protein
MVRTSLSTHSPFPPSNPNDGKNIAYMPNL